MKSFKNYHVLFAAPFLSPFFVGEIWIRPLFLTAPSIRASPVSLHPIFRSLAVDPLRGKRENLESTCTVNDFCSNPGLVTKVY